jgi:hypothetical protein
VSGPRQTAKSVAHPLSLTAWWATATILPFAIAFPASIFVVLQLSWGTFPGLAGEPASVPVALLGAGTVLALVAAAILSLTQPYVLRRTLPTWSLLPNVRHWAYGTFAGTAAYLAVPVVVQVALDVLQVADQLPAVVISALASIAGGAAFGTLQPAFTRWPRGTVLQWLAAYTVAALFYATLYSSTRGYVAGLAPEFGFSSSAATLAFVGATALANGILFGAAVTIATLPILLRARTALPPVPFDADLAEASTNFDFQDLQPFFQRVSRLVEAGFGKREIDQLLRLAARLDHDEEDSGEFLVTHNGQKVIMRVSFFMDDIAAPDTYVFTTPDLAAAVQEEMRLYAEELGR